MESNPCLIKFGVPKGSVLVSLFLIYKNDVTVSSRHGKFILCADDTNIFVSGNN